MTSFAVECEPRPQPRLAAGALLLHLLAAGWPWITRCPPWIAAPMSLVAMLGLAATLARLPGAHCRLQGLSFRDGGWHVRLWRESGDGPARIGRGTRVHAGLVAIDLIAGRERLGWVLTRSAMDPSRFRRLKARLRLAC
jgi:hypothetical protein